MDTLPDPAKAQVFEYRDLWKVFPRRPIAHCAPDWGNRWAIRGKKRGNIS
jgi:hypothetical protein